MLNDIVPFQEFGPHLANRSAGASADNAWEEQVPVASGELPDELHRYLLQFYGVFGRRETFERAGQYTVGLLSALPRKNGETMAASIASVPNKQSIYQFLAVSPWRPEELDRLRVRHALDVASSGRECTIVIDEVSQLKQGRHSVGVKRQYLGCAGKTANGQVAVTLHYCDDRYDWPITGQLYLPKDWAQDEARRQAAHVPADVRFATKGQIALALLDRARSWGVPVHAVAMDAGYADLDTLATLDEQGLAFYTGVKSDFGVRVPDEVAAWMPAAPPPRRRGRPRIHPDPRLLPPVYRADAIRAAIPEDLWRSVTYREGTAGLLTKQFAAIEVQCATAERTGPTAWLLFERPCPDTSGAEKQYVLAPRRATTLDDLAQLAHRRPVIERFSYENGKGDVGLSDYQGRSWQGFHHHLAMVMIALTWLNLQRQPRPTSADRPRPTSAPAERLPSPPNVALACDGREPTFRVAPVHPTGIPVPRHAWESVQAVHRRWLQWSAIIVHQLLARREQPLVLPRFVPLC